MSAESAKIIAEIALIYGAVVVGSWLIWFLYGAGPKN